MQLKCIRIKGAVGFVLYSRVNQIDVWVLPFRAQGYYHQLVMLCIYCCMWNPYLKKRTWREINWRAFSVNVGGFVEPRTLRLHFYDSLLMIIWICVFVYPLIINRRWIQLRPSPTSRRSFHLDGNTHFSFFTSCKIQCRLPYSMVNLDKHSPDLVETYRARVPLIDQTHKQYIIK